KKPLSFLMFIKILQVLVLMQKTRMMHFQFGDIISFKPKCWAGFRFMHFAVYVGDVDFCGKKQTEVIYEQSKKVLRCRFSELHMNLEPEVNNYLDDYTDPSSGRTYCKGDDKSILDRITETYEDSGMYGLFHYNCEHLATYVRYGVKVAVQVSACMTMKKYSDLIINVKPFNSNVFLLVSVNTAASAAFE
uniref:LRAT domain-containing protein n=1 Tax=Oryzias sinensis TaxID=183150 RepID=A0A8C7X0Q2_9TELE